MTDEPAQPTDVFEFSRTTFVERVQKLTGTTTWREPMLGGVSTANTIPDAHLAAAAMAYAKDKDDPRSVAHHIAYALYVGGRHWQDEIVTAVEEQLLDLESRMHVTRGARKSIARMAAIASYLNVMRGDEMPKPAACGDVWYFMVRVGERWLYAQAEQAIARAERAYHNARGP